MRIIGCDLHARQQTVAMLDTDSGELVEKTLQHDGEELRKFYSGLTRPVLVGIEATGSMQWFLEMMEELGIECRVGDPAKIRAAEPRKQKNDRRDAQLLLKLLVENRFPTIWMPSTEQRDLRALLRHRHQWVRLRSRVQHTLQSMALNHGLRRGHALWNQAGQHALWTLPLAPHAIVVSKLAHIAAAIFHDIDFVAVMNRLHSGKRNTDFCPKSGQNDLLATGFLDCRDEVFVIPGVHRGSLDRLLAGKYRAELRPHISAERLRLDCRQNHRHIEHLCGFSEGHGVVDNRLSIEVAYAE